MKTGILFALLTLNSQCPADELAWHDFDATDHVPRRIDLNGATVEVVQRVVLDAAFKEDNLTLSFIGKDSKKCDIWFTSSYGSGSIALEGRLLFLRYGIGRGTFAREEHVRIYLVGQNNGLQEMADVKVSEYSDITESKSNDPIRIEYQIHVSEDKASTTIEFIPPSTKGLALPKKTVCIALKGEQVVAPNGP